MRSNTLFPLVGSEFNVHPPMKEWESFYLGVAHGIFKKRQKFGILVISNGEKRYPI
jgi:hypothetical protein